MSRKLADRGMAISKVSSPVLDKLFSKSHVQRPSVAYATPTTPIESLPGKVRGVSRLVVQEIFKRKLTYDHPVKLENQYMRVVYFPPWHPLAAARTTRPAIVVTYNTSLKFNGKPINAYPIKTFGTAVFRNKAKFIYKRLFMDAWNKNGLDGLYVIAALKFPEEKEFSRIAQGLAEYMQLVRNTPPKWSTSGKYSSRLSPRTFTSVGLPVPPPSEPYDWDMTRG